MFPLRTLANQSGQSFEALLIVQWNPSTRHEGALIRIRTRSAYHAIPESHLKTTVYA